MTPRTPRAEATDADQVAAGAAEVLAPEVGLLADSDPVLFARAFARAAAAAGKHPLGVASAATRWAGRLVAGAGDAGLAAFGTAADVGADRRFADPAWRTNPWFVALHRTWQASADLLEELVQLGETDAITRRKAQFLAGLLADALAPTNFLPGNPAALKRAFETGGLSTLRGVRNLVDDALHHGGMPRQVDASGFTLGENLAATPGQVVFRNDLMELLQFAPQTPDVHAVPLLLSPPWINKYYVMDLAPGRSFVEWAVQHGHTVFAISYRQPDATMRATSMDDYLLHGPHTALEVIAEITGSEQAHVVGLCLGGALTAMLVAWLGQQEPGRVRAVTLLNTMLDFSEPGVLGSFTDPETVALLERKMARRGYLEGREMAGTFDVIRANDLIFNYVVSGWLLGEPPPAFDILAWNEDSTRMPATMHGFYLRSCYLENAFARGDLELSGRQLSPKDIACDAFVVAAENDHIVPWRSSYRTTQLVGGDVEFVLSSAGHIAGIVNPPNPKARHWLQQGEPPPADPDRWLAAATEHQGSWWERWAGWASERGGERAAPPPLGTEQHPPLEPAPGRYVRQR